LPAQELNYRPEECFRS